VTPLVDSTGTFGADFVPSNQVWDMQGYRILGSRLPTLPGSAPAGHEVLSRDTNSGQGNQIMICHGQDTNSSSTSPVTDWCHRGHSAGLGVGIVKQLLLS
jgi:hypothetical protein